MSVIIYEDDKFYRIASTLKSLHSQDIAHLWRYPDNWQNGGMDKYIDDFVQELRNANIQAGTERYTDQNEPFEELNFKTRGSWYTVYELVKSLQGVSYNIVESVDFEDTKKRLFNVIYYFMSGIVNKLPEYNKAQTW